MHFQILSTVLLIFVVQAQSAELTCYICNDCAKINANTPVLKCNAGYFNPDGTTESTMITTTTLPTTTEDTKTTEPPLMPSTTQTTTKNTEMPTPPTVGPVETTTPVPTPPDAELMVIHDQNSMNQTVNALLTNLTTTTSAPVEATTSAPVEASTSSDLETTTPNRTYTASSEFRIRQVRALIENDITYHCYSVQKSLNGTLAVERGCARVTTAEAVCPQLQTLNTGVKLSKCNPCSMSRCNGSSSLAVSAAALIFALVAVFSKHN